MQDPVEERASRTRDGRPVRLLKAEHLVREPRFPVRGGPQRGSSQLWERLTGRTLTDAHLKRLADALDVDEVQMLDWFPKGIPNPETGEWTVLVPPHRLRELLERLLDLDDLRLVRLKAFPNGIPVIDEIIVMGEVGPGLGR